MAYIRDYTYYAEQGAVTSITGALPSHETNDLLIFYVAKDSNSGGSWTHDGTLTEISNDQTGSLNVAAFWRVAGASESAITFSTTHAEQYGLMIIAVADVDTADPINNSRIDTASGGTITTTGLALDEDDCMVFYLHASDDTRWPNIDPGLMALDVPVTGVQFQMSAAWTWLFGSGAGGTTATPTYDQANNDRTQKVITVGVNSSNTTPVIAPHCDYANPPSEIIAPLHHTSYSGGTYGGGAVNPTATVSTIDGVTMNYQAPQSHAGGTVDGRGNGIRLGNLSSTLANQFHGFVWACTEKSLASKKACLHFRAIDPEYFSAVDNIASGGVVVGFRSDNAGTLGYRLWKVSGLDAENTPLNMAVGTFDVDDTALKLQDYGTFNSAKVDGIFYAVKKGVDVSMRYLCVESHTIEPIVIIGGSSALPATGGTVADSVKASNIMTVDLAGGYKSRHPIQIGNGSDPVYWKQGNTTFVFYSPPSGRAISHAIAADQHGLTVYLSASCTMDLSNQVWNGPATWPLALHASTSTSGAYVWSGCVIIGADVTLRSGCDGTGAGTFSGCGEITHNSFDFSNGWVFDAPTGTQAITITGATEAALQTAIDKYASCTFSNSTTYGLTISFTGTGNVSLNAPSNLTVDELLYTSSNSSALTVVVGSSGSTFPSTAIGGSATSVTISNDKTLTVNISVTGAEVTLLEDGTATEIDHTETAGTTYTYVYTYSTDTAADLQVFLPGYKPYWNGSVTLGNADQTITVDLEADPAYG